MPEPGPPQAPGLLPWLCPEVTDTRRKGWWQRVAPFGERRNSEQGQHPRLRLRSTLNPSLLPTPSKKV